MTTVHARACATHCHFNKHTQLRPSQLQCIFWDRKLYLFRLMCLYIPNIAKFSCMHFINLLKLPPSAGGGTSLSRTHPLWSAKLAIYCHNLKMKTCLSENEGLVTPLWGIRFFMELHGFLCGIDDVSGPIRLHHLLQVWSKKDRYYNLTNQISVFVTSRTKCI